MLDRLRRDLGELMRIPGLSGHEDRVRAAIAARLDETGLSHRTDTLGNLIATVPGDGPSVMIFAHMDQLGFFVRKLYDDGLIGVERMGGVPERTVLAQAVTLSGRKGDVTGIIGSTSHHVTPPAEKFRVPTTQELRISTGHTSAAEVVAAGIEIGTPVVYAPQVVDLAGTRVAGTAIDDRAGCAVLMELARDLPRPGPTLHLVFSVLEEFNLRGAVTVAQTLQPDIAIQLDLMVATDTPDTADLGEMRLGGGPGMSLYSFHGRGTLNGVIPHPALVALTERAAEDEGIALQRSARVGVLTDLSYVQTVGSGVASIDLGFPMRHSHSPMELVDLEDLAGLTRLLRAMLARIGPDFETAR